MSGPSPIDHFSELIEAAAGVVEETDLERVLRRLASEAMSATGARYTALGVIGEHGVLTDFLHEGMSDDQVERIGKLPTGRGVLGTVIRLNKTIRVERISDHPDAFGFPEHHPPMTNFLGVPVAVGEEAFGNLYLTEKESGFSDQDVLVVEALSRIAGAAVRTSRLQNRLRQVAVVEDRQRIARELHDSVIQELFAVGLGLQGVYQLVLDPHAQSTLSDAVDRLDGAVEALRTYIFQLRDVSGRTPALRDRLEDLMDGMAAAYPTAVRLEAQFDATGDEVLDNEIVKIVTEALSNALRHSSADTVEVGLSRDESHYIVRVSDDGVGFEVDSPSVGMGLGNIRTRARRLGGEIAISSRPGAGTEVVARLPVSSPGTSR